MKPISAYDQVAPWGKSTTTRSHHHPITPSPDNHIPDSDELTREIVRSLQAKTESELKIYEQNKAERDKIIALLQSTCRHAWIWLNDPHYHSLHECRKCGKMEAVGFGNIY